MLREILDELKQDEIRKAVISIIKVCSVADENDMEKVKESFKSHKNSESTEYENEEFSKVSMFIIDKLIECRKECIDGFERLDQKLKS